MIALFTISFFAQAFPAFGRELNYNNDNNNNNHNDKNNENRNTHEVSAADSHLIQSAESVKESNSAVSQPVNLSKMKADALEIGYYVLTLLLITAYIGLTIYGWDGWIKFISLKLESSVSLSGSFLKWSYVLAAVISSGYLCLINIHTIYMTVFALCYLLTNIHYFSFLSLISYAICYILFRIFKTISRLVKQIFFRRTQMRKSCRG